MALTIVTLDLGWDAGVPIRRALRSRGFPTTALRQRGQKLCLDVYEPWLVNVLTTCESIWKTKAPHIVQRINLTDGSTRGSHAELLAFILKALDETTADTWEALASLGGSAKPMLEEVFDTITDVDIYLAQEACNAAYQSRRAGERQ